MLRSRVAVVAVVVLVALAGCGGLVGGDGGDGGGADGSDGGGDGSGGDGSGGDGGSGTATATPTPTPTPSQSISIESEQTEDGVYFYVTGAAGLPEGTNVSVRSVVRGESGTFSVTASVLLNESVPPDTRLYLGNAEGGTLNVSVGERPGPEVGFDPSQLGGSSEAVVTISVDTGDRTAEREFTYGGS